MVKLQNPFVTGGYIAPEYFCDREKETNQLLKYIKNETKHHSDSAILVVWRLLFTSTIIC